MVGSIDTGIQYGNILKQNVLISQYKNYEDVQNKKKNQHSTKHDQLFPWYTIQHKILSMNFILCANWEKPAVSQFQFCLSSCFLMKRILESESMAYGMQNLCKCECGRT
jgi:hypothetical protein